MKKVVIGFVAFFLLTGLGRCGGATSWRDNDFETHQAPVDHAKVQLPESLWSALEGLLSRRKAYQTAYEEVANAKSKKKAEQEAAADAAEGRQSEEAGGEGSETSAADSSEKLATEFAPLKVYLVERNDGILGGRHHQIDLASGGGDIDLAEFVKPLNGSFYFVVEFIPEVENLDRKVFYLSNALIRKRKDERVGAGCNVFFDVSRAFSKALKGQGFLINTSEQRHVSALAGTYFFAAVHEQKLYIAHLKITDSRYREILCPPR